MKKKLTLSDAQDKLFEYESFPQSVKDEVEKHLEEIPALPASITPIMSYRYYKDGTDMRHCVCPNCGNEWDEEYRYSYSYGWRRSSEPLCKKCHNANMAEYNVGSVITRKANKITFIPEVDFSQGYVIIMQFTMQYLYTLDGIDVEECIKNGDYSFLKGTFEKSLDINEAKVGIFMLDKGFRVLGTTRGDTKLLKNGSSDSDREIRNLVYGIDDGCIINHNLKEAAELLSDAGYPATEKNFLKVMNSVHDSFIAKAERAAEKRAIKPTQELMSYVDYEPEDFDTIEIAKSIAKPLSLLINRFGTTSEYVVYCPNCQTISTVTTDSESSRESVCPNCGVVMEEHRGYGYGYGSRGNSTSASFKFKTLELNKDTNDILLRVFDVTETLKIEMDIDFTVEEIRRIYFTDKKIICLVKTREGSFEKGNAYDMDFEKWSEKDNLITPREEVIDIIKNSTLKYSGLLEAWGYVDDVHSIDIPGNISRRSYIYNWYRRPCMEQLIKTGLYKAASDVLSEDNDRLGRFNVNLKATSLYEILNITKPVFKIARRLNLGLYDISYLRKLWEFDNTITEQTFNAIKNLGAVDAICDIASRYNIPFAKIIEYIDSCYNNQCIEKNEAIRLWADYLRMAKDMTYRLDNKNTKFPQSLKKEHDRAVFSYKVVQDEMNRKRFTEQAKENAKYEYSFEKLMVKVPRTPEEIVEEGTNQKHCVASYVNSVREGNTVVAFIRYKETPDDSYFTIEIKDDRIVQVRGYTNCAPTDPKLLEFLKKFATAKHLKLAYR